jgi:hypothetical protein
VDLPTTHILIDTFIRSAYFVVWFDSHLSSAFIVGETARTCIIRAFRVGTYITYKTVWFIPKLGLGARRPRLAYFRILKDSWTTDRIITTAIRLAICETVLVWRACWLLTGTTILNSSSCIQYSGAWLLALDAFTSKFFDLRLYICSSCIRAALHCLFWSDAFNVRAAWFSIIQRISWENSEDNYVGFHFLP